MIRTIVARIEAENGKAPGRFLLFREGWSEIEGEGNVFVDRAAFDLVAANLQRRGNDVVIDYEHQTLLDVQAPAAGFITGLAYEDGVGIWAVTTWNQRANEYVTAGEYRYFSPVFAIRKSDSRLIAIHSVALTNAPKTNHITPLLAAKLEAEYQPVEREEHAMEFFTKLFNLLRLAAGATEDDVIAAVTKLRDKPPETREVLAKEVMDALNLKPEDTVSTVVASIHAMRQGEKGMVPRAEFDALKNQLAERDAAEVVAAALKAGKVTPDQKEWATAYAKADPAGFATFIAKAPVVIPMGDLPDGYVDPNDPTVNSATLSVAKLMNVDPEDIKKYGK
jgi:phage I-like protein